MDRNRIIIGGILTLLGIILARIKSLPFINIEGLIVYIIGVILGILGLGIIASGLSKERVKMKMCPSCFTLNPTETAKCFRCSKEI